MMRQGVPSAGKAKVVDGNDDDASRSSSVVDDMASSPSDAETEDGFDNDDNFSDEDSYVYNDESSDDEEDDGDEGSNDGMKRPSRIDGSTSNLRGSGSSQVMMDVSSSSSSGSSSSHTKTSSSAASDGPRWLGDPMAPTLYRAVLSRDWAAAHHLLLTQSRPANRRDASYVSPPPERETTLHAACLRGAPANLIEAVLTAKVESAWAVDGSRRTPLHHACRSATGEVIQLLLECHPQGYGAEDTDGKTPLDVAREEKRDSSILSAFDDARRLHEALLSCRWSTVRDLLRSEEHRKKVEFLRFDRASQTSRRGAAGAASKGDHNSSSRAHAGPSWASAQRRGNGDEWYGDDRMPRSPRARAMRRGRAISSEEVSRTGIPAALEAKIRADQLGLEKGTALHWALLQEGEVDVIEELMRINPEALTMTDARGQTPLYIACNRTYRSVPKTANSHNNSTIDATQKVVKMILEASPGAVSITTNDGSTPLHAAVALRKPVALLEALLEAEGGQQAGFVQDAKGRNPLYLACEQCMDSAIDLLLDRCDPKVTIAAKSKKGSTALHVACHSAAQRLAKKTLARIVKACPAAASIADDEGRTPLLEALETNKHIDLIRVLTGFAPETMTMPDKKNRTPLSVACEYACNEATLMMLDNFPDAVSMQDDQGKTPLLAACLRKRYFSEISAPNVIRTLISADPTQVAVAGKNGQTPLHVACENKAREVTLALIDACPAAVSVRDDTGKTPLLIALMNDSPLPMVQSLVSTDPSQVLIADSGGRTPLHGIIPFGSEEKIRMLVNGCPGAVSQLSRNGNTPINLACRHHRSARLVSFLLRADPKQFNVPDEYGLTPAFYLYRHAHGVIATKIKAGIRPPLPVEDAMAAMDAMDESADGEGVADDSAAEDALGPSVPSLLWEGTAVPEDLRSIYNTARLLLLAEEEREEGAEETEQPPWNIVRAAIASSLCPETVVALVIQVHPGQALAALRQDPCLLHKLVAKGTPERMGFHYCDTCSHRESVAIGSEAASSPDAAQSEHLEVDSDGEQMFIATTGSSIAPMRHLRSRDSRHPTSAKDPNVKGCHLHKHASRVLCTSCLVDRVMDYNTVTPDMTSGMVPAIIRHLIPRAPLAASTPDPMGRLLLTIAIENGRRWDTGLNDTFQAAPRAVHTRDVGNLMYPFMLAAVGNWKRFEICATTKVDDELMESDSLQEDNEPFKKPRLESPVRDILPPDECVRHDEANRVKVAGNKPSQDMVAKQLTSVFHLLALDPALVEHGLRFP